MLNTEPSTEICICGDTFIVEPYMIDLERKLCDPCFNREAYIILLQERVKALKHERPYSVRPLVQLKEYHATKTQLTD